MQNMLAFEGYLDRIERSELGIRVRLVVGGFDPKPATAPAILLTVESPPDIGATHSALLRAQEEDSDCYITALSSTEACLTTNHGDEIVLRGVSVVATEAGYDAQDFERLAKQNYDWGLSQLQAFREQFDRLNRIRALAYDQRSRVLVKIQGHAPGSTAHTLYEQQLAFLSRLLEDEV